MLVKSKQIIESLNLVAWKFFFRLANLGFARFKILLFCQRQIISKIIALFVYSSITSLLRRILFSVLKSQNLICILNRMRYFHKQGKIFLEIWRTKTPLTHNDVGFARVAQICQKLQILKVGRAKEPMHKFLSKNGIVRLTVLHKQNYELRSSKDFQIFGR